MNGMTAFSGVGAGRATTVFTGAIGGQPRIGILRGSARQDDDGCKVHDAAKQRAAENQKQPSDHGQLLVVTSGIGTSRPALVETPTAVS